MVRLGLTYLILIVASVIAIFPILQVFNISLRPADQFASTSLGLIPEGASFKAYYTILFEKDFLRWLINSLIVSLTTTLIGVTLASTAGYAFSRFRFPGRKAGMQMFLVSQMFPATMLLLPMFIMMRKLGLIDSFIGVIIAYVVTALPFCVWTMKGYYDTIPPDLEEAARIDGCGDIGVFTKVTLPLASPALAITGLFSFMTGWSEFMVARVIISSKDLFTLPLGLENLTGTFSTEWANYAAGSFLVCVPVVVLFVVLSKFLVGGLTLGGVKG
ncbi:MAG: sugar ABC transporter permease [bacterium]|nr:sugar ABC transporter permease [bacterium]